MSEKRDYYDILGVSRDASDDDVRKAWRQAALKYHPDRNQGDAGAEAKFKEAHEAFQVLSDREKRSAYDRFGHAAFQGGPGVGNADIGDILSQFQDLFSDFFGGFGGSQRQARRRGPEPGQDIRVDAELNLAEVMKGTKKELTVHGAVPCDGCKGSGAEPGHPPVTCSTCGGSGQVGTQRGFIMFASTCHRCGGRGQVIERPCQSCRGSGRVQKSRTVLVTFPAGVDTGQRLRVSGQGMPGQPGAPAGDLYVDVRVADDESFERQGYDLATRERITFADAALGCEIEIELPDGNKTSVKVQGGTQPGTVITLRGQGIPRLDRRGRGDLHAVIEVAVPKKLSKRAKKLLEELDEELARTNEARTA